MSEKAREAIAKAMFDFSGHILILLPWAAHTGAMRAPWLQKADMIIAALRAAGFAVVPIDPPADIPASGPQTASLRVKPDWGREKHPVRKSRVSGA